MIGFKQHIEEMTVARMGGFKDSIDKILSKKNPKRYLDNLSDDISQGNITELELLSLIPKDKIKQFYDIIKQDKKFNGLSKMLLRKIK